MDWLGYGCLGGIKIMSTIKAKQLQLGDNATATQNFVWQTNNDGTAKLARGNVGATTQDILTVDAAGNLGNKDLPMYACRAWGKFTGATGALLAGGNCTVSRDSLGLYTITFITAMPDVNYSVVVNGFETSGPDAGSSGVVVAMDGTTTYFKIDCEIGNATPTQADPVTVSFAVFR
jgi:hypothetical protein